MRVIVPNLLNAAVLAALLAGFGCSRDPAETSGTAPGPTAPPEGPPQAVAELSPTQGNDVRGTVRFFQVGSSVRVIAQFSGLSVGEHGFHIHENGDCSAPDASSAGGHFNPTGAPHGARTDGRRHAGDLGNLTADENGNAHADFLDTVIELNGPRSILDRAVVVHQGRDDLTSQPSGDSGARVACGVIRAQ